MQKTENFSQEINDLRINKNPSFCIDPFIHLVTRPLGIVKTCCNTDMHIGNLNDDDVDTLWNSDTIKNIRLKMLKGEKLQNCKRCYVEEAVGFESKRIKQNRKWSHLINSAVSEIKPDGSMPNKIRFLDLRYGIKCNLKCIICDNTNSSQWISEQKKIYPKMQNSLMKDYYKEFNIDVKTPSYWHKNPSVQEQIFKQLKYVEQLYFAGGEPLIIDEHYKTLEECVSRGYAGNIELRYNSNAIKWREDLFDLWKNFKNINFCYSIDDIEKRNDYIRHPSKWKKTKETLQLFDQKNLDNVSITITCAVQVLNIYYIPDFIIWFFKQSFRKIKDIQFHLVYYPPQLSPKVLPPFFKKKLLQKYTGFLSAVYKKRQMNNSLQKEEHNIYFQKYFQILSAGEKTGFKEVFNMYLIKRLESIMRFIASEDHSYRLPMLREYLNLLDKSRGTSFQKIFPELDEIFKDTGENNDRIISKAY